MSELAGRVSELEQAEKRLEVLTERVEEEIYTIEQELTGFWDAACTFSSELDDYMAERHMPAIEEQVGYYVALANRMDPADLALWAGLVRVRDGVDGTLPEGFPDLPVRKVTDRIPAMPTAEMDEEEREDAWHERLRHCQEYVQESDDMIEDFTEAARKAAEAGNAGVAVREFCKAQEVCAQIEVAYQEWWHALGEASRFGMGVLGPVFADHVRMTMAELESHARRNQGTGAS